MPVGHVKKTEDRYAIVVIERQDMCGECHACEVLGEVKKCEITCMNICQAKVGDKVLIDLSNNAFLKATAIMYAIPLMSLIVGMWIGQLAFGYLEILNNEVGMLVGGVGLMTASYFYIKSKDKKKHYTKLLPTTKKILE